MLINKIHINNFKSLVDLRINNPSPFTVFFGTNASGKSNLFDALELSSFVFRKSNEALKFFGSFKELFTVQRREGEYKTINIRVETPNGFLSFNVIDDKKPLDIELSDANLEIKNLLGESFSRIFLGKEKINKEIFKDDKKLISDGSNLIRVLNRLLKSEVTKEEIIEWLQFLIPELKNLEIKQNELTGEDYLLIWEENSSEPFSGNLISDGTINSISLLSSLYQIETPQFLLIEEPENGLNPKIIREFVRLCRDLVKERNHVIWLASHSQTLVSEIKPEEAILIYKESGITRIKQFLDLNLYDLKMDEAWLSNTLGGGIPW